MAGAGGPVYAPAYSDQRSLPALLAELREGARRGARLLCGLRPRFRSPNDGTRRDVLFSGGGFGGRKCHDLAHGSTRRDSCGRARQSRDIGRIAVVDLLGWDAADRIAYDAAETWEAQAGVVERIQAERPVLHADNGVALIEVRPAPELGGVG